MTKFSKPNTLSPGLLGESRLKKAVQVALASTALVSGMANALLRDHGPLSTTNHFPQWYRENPGDGGMAMGQCITTDDAGNGPLCLTSTADAAPGRFAGNIGPEAFYATADIVMPLTGGELTWIGHLEMAYLTADGEPPAVWNANDPQEIVFSRERIRIDLPTTQDGSCNGTYTIRTPFSVRDYDMQEGNRALFFTDDINPLPGNFVAALRGHTGPFLKWDVGQDGVNPVSAANPAVVFTPPSGAPRKYIGDPNIPHTFVGSSLPAGANHPEKVFNNYVEITPPATCDLGAGPGGAIFEDQAGITGLIWDLPISDPVAITKATYVRDNSKAAVDVWAEGNNNQTLVLTASSDSYPHLPSITMPEEEVNGNPTGRYHAHVEFAAAEAIPDSVTVTNLSSNPVAHSTRAVVDSVVVTKAEFDPVTKTLCIAAHSGDQVDPKALNLLSPNYGAFHNPTSSCNGSIGDKVMEKDLASFAPDFRIPPEGILVQSELGGSETSHPVSLTGSSDAAAVTGAVNDDFDNVKGSGTSTLDLTSASFGAAPGIVKTTASADTTPGTFRIVVVNQPEHGTIFAPANGGSVTYTAEEGMETSIQSFNYAIQNTVTSAVSNVAKVDLHVTKSVAPPVAVGDSQGVFRTGSGVINVLTNDVTGPTPTAIDPTSIVIATLPTRGNVVVNGDGTVTYTPVGQGATANNTIDTFTYTVANTAGSRSAPATVQVVLKSAAEAVAFQRVRWSGRWDIRFTSSYAGPSGAVTLAPAATCSLIGNPGGQTGTIASNQAPGAGTNAYQVVGAGPAGVNNTWTVRCTTSSGGAQNRTGQL